MSTCISDGSRPTTNQGQLYFYRYGWYHFTASCCWCVWWRVRAHDEDDDEREGKEDGDDDHDDDGVIPERTVPLYLQDAFTESYNEDEVADEFANKFCGRICTSVLNTRTASRNFSKIFTWNGMKCAPWFSWCFTLCVIFVASIPQLNLTQRRTSKAKQMVLYSIPLMLTRREWFATIENDSLWKQQNGCLTKTLHYNINT